MLKCIHILHLRVVKYTKEKNAMNVEAREKKETLKFAILQFYWSIDKFVWLLKIQDISAREIKSGAKML